ncbi:MAG TPA: WXG100 family type VII secretion target [Nocardioides sp.]|uniref:WXG100 family type VII secretion target n=1 Tax=Nocardioides sp. TaxID=35761 RepID=UPI002E36AB3A|nr:WXG100 family type VII secretion target [Nocardioides sp.]HEX3930885.1 WXG100 family type VII secretion target [Nocardioides sp.]
MTVHSAAPTAGRTTVQLGGGPGRLAIDEPAFERARRDVVEAHDAVERGRRALSGQARELFADGWRGPAAREYARAWEEWESGAGQMVGALLALSTAMAVAGAELVGADSAVAAQSGRLHARLDG